MKWMALSFVVAMVGGGGCSDADRGSTDDPRAMDELDALQSGGGGFGGRLGRSWCRARNDCYDRCDADYPRGGGPLQTCRRLCDSNSACPSATIGGAFIE